MVFSNSQMKLNSSIRLEGSYHIVDGFSPQRFTFLTLLLHLLSRSYIYFLSLLQITNDVFLTYLQMWLPESDVRRIIRKMLSFHGKTEKNCCLVDTAFSTGCDEKSFVSIFGESAAELPPQPLPGAAPPFIEAASSARKDGSPPHALHTRTVRR